MAVFCGKISQKSKLLSLDKKLKVKCSFFCQMSNFNVSFIFVKVYKFFKEENCQEVYSFKDLLADSR